MATSDKRMPSRVVADAADKVLNHLRWSNGCLHEVIEDAVGGDAVCAIGAVNVSINAMLSYTDGDRWVDDRKVMGAATVGHDAATALCKAAFSEKVLDQYSEDGGWLYDFNDAEHHKYPSGSTRGKRRVQRRLCTLAKTLRRKGY